MLNIPTSSRVALLIDAENVSLNQFPQLLKLAHFYGDLKYCRAYGDWKKVLKSFYQDRNTKYREITFVQVEHTGKNAADKLLKQDAKEIVAEGSSNIFIIASGDGHFRPLCDEITQKGHRVIGVGNKKQTSSSLPKSCTFYYVEHLEEVLPEQEKLQAFKTLLFRVLASTPHDDAGWIHCSTIGTQLRTIEPHFKTRFGSKKLSKWLGVLNNQLERNGQMVRVVDSTHQVHSPVVGNI